MFFGYRIMAGGSLFKVIPLNLTVGDYGKQVTSSDDYVDALTKANANLEPVSFFETFAQMFSRDLPATLDANLLATTMNEWKNFWMLPAIMAAVVFVVFAIAFWDKAETDDADEAQSKDV